MSISSLIFAKVQPTDDAAMMGRLMSSSHVRVREAFLQAVRTVKSHFNLIEIANLLDQGRVEEALRFIEAIPATISTAVSFSLISSGNEGAALLSRYLEVPVNFDQTNFRAVDIMRENNLRLVQQFTQGQRDATNEALRLGIERGLNPREQARNFRGSIGLTASQVRAVNNYRNLLESGSRQALNRELRDRRFDRTVVRATTGGAPLTDVQINRMVERYEERYLIYRSEVIARTEALRAVHQGTEELYQQAFDTGELSPDQLERTWRIAGGTTKDGVSRTRDSHFIMNGQTRPIGEVFISGQGANLRYPGDIDAPIDETAQCRCIIATRFL